MDATDKTDKWIALLERLCPGWEVRREETGWWGRRGPSGSDLGPFAMPYSLGCAMTVESFLAPGDGCGQD